MYKKLVKLDVLVIALCILCAIIFSGCSAEPKCYDVPDLDEHTKYLIKCEMIIKEQEEYLKLCERRIQMNNVMIEYLGG